MPVLVLCFLLGCASGLRSLTPPASLCWAAHRDWLHLAKTRLAFIGHWPTVALFTLLALAELVADKLPATPARTEPAGMTARIIVGCFSGIVIAVSTERDLFLPAIAGIAGALVGTFAGYKVRRAAVLGAQLPDLVVASAEDVIAIAASLLIASHV